MAVKPNLGQLADENPIGAILAGIATIAISKTHPDPDTEKMLKVWRASAKGVLSLLTTMGDASETNRKLIAKMVVLVIEHARDLKWQ